MIRVILFDADGVLIRGEMASRYFEQKYGITHETTVAFYRGPFLDCLLGKQDMHDLLPAYLKKWGWKKSTEAFIAEWFDYENKVDQALVHYVQELRGRGIRCYVVTNQEKHRAEYMLQRMGFATSFDGLFASAHLGAVKPDRMFYERVMHELPGTTKEQVLFWDDSEANVAGAREFGLHGELYSDEVDYKAVTESYITGSSHD